VIFIGLFERGDDKSNLTAEKWFKINFSLTELTKSPMRQEGNFVFRAGCLDVSMSVPV